MEDDSECNETELTEEMYEFLTEQGVTTAQILEMRFNELTPNLLKGMKEEDLKQFIPKYSQRLALKDFLNLKLGTRRKEKLVHDLKLKMKRYGLDKKDHGKSKKQRAERQILLGWIMCWDGKKYTQVREPLGGGTRQLYVPITADKEYILRKAIDFFFPNGKTKKLKIEDYEVDLFNSQQEPIEETETVQSIATKTALQKLRFYLATKPKKVFKNQHVESDISTDDSEELVSYKQVRKSKRSSKPNITTTSTSRVVLDKMNDHDFKDADENEGQCLDGLQSVEIFNKSHCQNNQVETDITDLSNEFTVLVNSILDGLPNQSVDSTDSTFLNNEPQDCNLPFTDDTFSINVPQSSNSSENVLLTDKIVIGEKIPQTFEDILDILKKSVNQEKSNTFNVFREEIFNCCVRAMRRQTFCPFNKMFVKFSDVEGLSEGAIDDGGPTREVFRLVMNHIKDSQMFVGCHKKHLSLNASALNDKHYFEAGRIIALSLVHGGPAPHFFSNLLFSLLTGEENVLPTFDDVDDEIKSYLIQMQKTESLSEAQNLITDTSIFSIAGYNFIFKLGEKPDIIQGTLKFYAIDRIREALAQFIDGLRTCNIYEYLKTFPHLFKSYMCNDIKNLTAEEFEKLFKISYSTIGSNTRIIENKIVSYFRDYLLDCETSEENTLDQDPSGEKNVTIKDILIFATGADQVPPLGFPFAPIITFLHEDTSIYPKANTCSLELKLPIANKNYEEFKKAMNFGIGNCNSFGFA